MKAIIQGLLESYEVELKTSAGKEIIKDFVSKQTFRYTFDDLNPGQESYMWCFDVLEILIFKDVLLFYFIFPTIIKKV